LPSLVKLWPASDGETTKTFDNAGLRLHSRHRSHLRTASAPALPDDLDDKARFLDACPHLLDDVQAIDKSLGREPSATGMRCRAASRNSAARRASRAGRRPSRKLFRSVFTQRIRRPSAVARGGRDDGYEPDADLRDFENVPLKDEQSTPTSSARRADVPTPGWTRSKDKVGYEINFNRHSTSTRRLVRWR